MSDVSKLRHARTAFALTMVCLCAVGCSQPTRQDKTSEARDGAPKRIALLNTDTGEHLSVVYREGGEYKPEAMSAISAVFRDRRTDEVKPVDPALVDYMADLVAATGRPDTTEIELTSGYRSPATNAALSRVNANVADDSYHMRGQAADFRVPGVPLQELASAATEMRRGGYAIYATHMHVDSGPFRTWGGHHDHEGDALIARASSKRMIALAKAHRPGAKPGPTREAARALAQGRKPASHMVATGVVPTPSKPAMVVRASFKVPAGKPATPTAKKVQVKPRERK